MKKEKNIKNIVILVVSIIVIIISVIFIILTINKNNQEKNTDDNQDITTINNQELLKDTKIEQLSITNQILYVRDGNSIYNATVKNNGNNNYQVNSIYVVFTIDKEELKVLALKDINLEAKESSNINISFDKDISKVTAINFVLE